MNNSILINGIRWYIRQVAPNYHKLVDRTGNLCLATTDPHDKTIYLSSGIDTSMLAHVVIHEIGHCVIYSYDLFDELHQMVRPEYRETAEEWLCNFIADYGMVIYESARRVLGRRALEHMPELISQAFN